MVVDVVGTDLLMELVRSAPPHLLSTRPGPSWMSRRQNGSLQFHQMPRRMTNQIATSCLVGSAWWSDERFSSAEPKHSKEVESECLTPPPVA